MKTLKLHRECFDAARYALNSIDKPFSMEFFRFDEDDPSSLGTFLFVIKNYQDEKIS